MGNLLRCDTPPPPGPRHIIRRIRANEKKQFVLLSKLHGCWTHYNGRTTQPCFDGKKQCEGCQRAFPKRWKGYIHCLNQTDATEEFLEVTPLFAKQLESCVGTIGPKMRGNRILVERGRGDKSRLRLELQSHCDVLPSCPALPDPKEPWETLERLWEAKLSDGPTVLPIPA